MIFDDGNYLSYNTREDRQMVHDQARSSALALFNVLVKLNVVETSILMKFTFLAQVDDFVVKYTRG